MAQAIRLLVVGRCPPSLPLGELEGPRGGHLRLHRVQNPEEACELLKQAGAKRAVLLPVSGAFHSPLMQQAADEFRGVLAKVTFRRGRCPVLSNVTARPESDPDRQRELLVEQLVSPVRWVDTVAALRGLEHGRCLEVGPGSVVKGLVKGCAPELAVVPCGTAENVYSVLSSAAS